jgi:hypothetical protein
MTQFRTYQIVLTKPAHSIPVQELLAKYGYEYKYVAPYTKDTGLLCLYINLDKYEGKEEIFYTDIQMRDIQMRNSSASHERHFSCNILENPEIISTWDGAKKSYPKDADGNELIPFEIKPTKLMTFRMNLRGIKKWR